MLSLRLIMMIKLFGYLYPTFVCFEEIFVQCEKLSDSRIRPTRGYPNTAIVWIQEFIYNTRPSETYLFRRPCFMAKSKTYFVADAAAGAETPAALLLGMEAAEAASGMSVPAAEAATGSAADAAWLAACDAGVAAGSLA